MRTLAIVAVLAPIVAAVALMAGQTSSRRAWACQIGPNGLEDFAPAANLILVGQVIEIGDNINRAPIVTPTLTPEPDVTPIVNPLLPEIPPTPFFLPVPTIDLTGIDAILSVEQTHAGSAEATFASGQTARKDIEEDLRMWEAGYPRVTSCKLDAFVPRYELGGRYLLFVEQTGQTAYVRAVFRLDGDTINLRDPLLNSASQGHLSMQETTYTSFFPGVEAEVRDGFAYVTSPSIPLAPLIAAALSLKGEQSITPPETGSGGLRATR